MYDIIFRGDILPGHRLSEVKEKLARLFKADPEKIDALFLGRAVPLKRNLDQATAEKYQAALKQAGADVQVAAAGAVQTKPVPVKKAPVMTLQQRLAAQEAERERQQADQARLVVEQEEPALFTLAPVGSDLLQEAEKPVFTPVVVDVSRISLRPEGGDLVEAAERLVVEPVMVQVEDYGLSELGEDLLHDFEKSIVPQVELILPDVELAPLGSDLGQVKNDPPPPPPDTSALSLVPEKG